MFYVHIIIYLKLQLLPATSASCPVCEMFSLRVGVSASCPVTRPVVKLTLTTCYSCYYYNYDVRFVLMKGIQPRPFAAVHLGPGEDIIDFAWNPGVDFAGLFAICLSKGGVHLLELKGSSVTQVASLPASTAATCRTFPVFFSFNSFECSLCLFQ